MATRPARRQLARAARELETARNRHRRRDTFESNAAWQTMASARWSVVDCFECDGTRYLVARLEENLAMRLDNLLSDRERQVAQSIALGVPSKRVAHDLELSESTVRVLMARVYAKLGVKGRAGFLHAWEERARART